MPGELEHITLQFPLLFGGISDQPPAVRFRNQLEKADNTIFSVAYGASKRPGTEFVTAVTTLPDSGGSNASDLPSGQFDELAPSDGQAACSCTPGDYASSYSLGYTLTIKIPDPVLCTSTDASQTGVTLTQVADQCLWAGSLPTVTTSKGNYIGRALLSLVDQPHCQWFLGFLLVNSENRADAEESTGRFSINKGGVSPIGDYPGTLNQGSCLTPVWQFDLSAVSIS
jgi:hypothetical protein